MQKQSLWLLVGLIIIVCALVLRLATPRNRWICEGGEWRAQGHPTASQPTTDCFDNLSIKPEIKALSELLENDKELATTSEEKPRVMATSTVESVSSSTEEIVFINDIAVELISPQNDELLRSPYRVEGRAKGAWFFEATLPIVLKTASGITLLETYGQADEDWMTSDWVNFHADLSFVSNGEKMGVLIIKKDNPSGLPENEAEVSYPVRLLP